MISSKMKKEIKLNKKKGFTLVELLAVIVVLAIILIIAIPSVLDAVNTSKRRTFVLYAQKVRNLGEQAYVKSQFDESGSSQCVLYNIENNLGLDTTGDFHGYVLVVNKDEPKYYLTLYNSSFMVYGADVDNDFGNDSLLTFTNSDDENLSKEHLLKLVDCDAYFDPGTGETEELPKPKKVAYLKTGLNLNNIFHSYISMETTSEDGIIYQFKRYRGTLPINPDECDVLSTNESEYPVYFWVDQISRIAYWYSDADIIYMNPDSSWLFRLLQISNYDLDGWDSSLVINMEGLFYESLSAIEYLDLTWLDTSNVEKMGYIFYGGFGYTVYEVKEIKVSRSKWNISKVVSDERMFQGQFKLIKDSGHGFCPESDMWECSAKLGVGVAKDISEGGLLTVVD